MIQVPVPATNADLYLDLMKKSLLASIYRENAWYVLGSLEDKKHKSIKGWLRAQIIKLAWANGLLIVKPKMADGEAANWGLFSYTMVGMPRLNNIQACIEDVIKNKIDGDLIETGVWRGGATIFMRAVMKAHGVTDRVVWVADSFEGLPTLTESETAHKDDTSVQVDIMNDGGPMQLGLAVSQEQVQENFKKFGLLDDQVRFLKGWFCDTLPNAPIDKLAILRLDGDMYQSTMDALNALYSKVSKGGYVIIDDYNSWPHCKKAVDDFRATHQILEPIIEIDECSIYWKVIELRN